MTLYKIHILGTQISIDILNNVPKLVNNMIPMGYNSK